VHKIGRADIITALANLAENRPRRIVEIMNGNTDVDLADIFFQTVVFKERCYYHSLPPDLAEKFKCKTVLHLAPPTHLW